MKRCTFFLGMLLACAAAQAQELKPFIRGSQKAIMAEHQGKPFILALWSLDCVHCRDDLDLIGKLQANHRELQVVLVATDMPEQRGKIAALLKQYHLQRAESWVFADSFAERLRYEIDPQWHGELPRTYFIGADGGATALSGRIERKQLEQWLRANLPHG